MIRPWPGKTAPVNPERSVVSCLGKFPSPSSCITSIRVCLMAISAPLVAQAGRPEQCYMHPSIACGARISFNWSDVSPLFFAVPHVLTCTVHVRLPLWLLLQGVTGRSCTFRLGHDLLIFQHFSVIVISQHLPNSCRSSTLSPSRFHHRHTFDRSRLRKDSHPAPL
jgi:hypothetical protein